MRDKSILIYMIVLVILVLPSLTEASTPALRAVTTEYVSEVIAYDQTLGSDDVITEARRELGENNSGLSRTGIPLQNLSVYGILNISNVESVGETTLVSINITLNNTQNITFFNLSSGPSYLVYNISSGINPSDEQNISIYIPELRYGDSVIFDFNISGSGLGEPLNFTENYTSWRMMTGDETHIILEATNSFPRPVKIFDIEVYKNPKGFGSLSGGYTYFNFSNLTGPDSTSADIFMSGGRSILNWNISDADLDPGETAKIRFDSLAPSNISLSWNDSADWATWVNMGNITANFKFNGSMSGIDISHISAVSPEARMSVTKDRMNETHWNASFNLSNDAQAELDYNVTQVSVWATKNQQYDDPGNKDTWVNSTNVTAYGFANPLGPYSNATWWPRLNLSNGSFLDNYSLNFNYSLVPVVWATTDFMILDDGTQLFKLNESRSLEDGYIFIEEIYVLLGGYLMKVTKEINPIGELAGEGGSNRYRVNITLENVGREVSPDWVSMFDLVPKDFWPQYYATNNNATSRNMTEGNIISVSERDGTWNYLVNSPDTVWGYSDTGNILSGPYKDYWGYHIDFKRLNASSDGDGRYDSNLSTSEIGITYEMVGNKTISSIENAYLVGVDPIRLEGANPSGTVASRLFAGSTSWEFVILISSLFISISVLAVGLRLRFNERNVKKSKRGKKR